MSIKYEIFWNNRELQTLQVGYYVGNGLYFNDAVPYPIKDGKFIEDQSERDAFFLSHVPDVPELPVIAEDIMAKIDALIIKQPTIYEDNTLQKAKILLMDNLNIEVDNALSIVTSQYPDVEKLTFDKQANEARELISNPKASAPFLRELASKRGMAVGDLAKKVLEKDAVFTNLSANFIGQRQKIETAIQNAATVEELQNVDTSLDYSGLPTTA